MLPLDSPRWRSFGTYFGSPEQVPQRLASWRQSIGSPAEESCWWDLSDQILHQGTITDAAFAAVPHVLKDLHLVEPRRRLEYLVGLSMIESARQMDSGAPALAADLADAYHKAVAQARRFAVELLALEWPKIEFRYILSILAGLHGHGVLGDLIFNMDSLCGDCPKCGESVYPDEIQDSRVC